MHSRDGSRAVNNFSSFSSRMKGKNKRLNILFFFSFKRFYFNSPVTLLVCIIAELVLI